MREACNDFIEALELYQPEPPQSSPRRYKAKLLRFLLHPPDRVGLGEQPGGEVGGRSGGGGEEFVDRGGFAVMHPRAPCELAIAEPVLAPIRRGFDELASIVRAVFQRAFDDDIDVGFQEWKAGIRFRQAFARHAALAYGNIDPDMARFRQALPRDRLDVVARPFPAGIALLARIELRHIVAFDRVEHAVDRVRTLTRMRLSQTKRGEAGGRTVVPGANVAEGGRDAHRDGWNRGAGGGIAGRGVDQRSVAEDELGWGVRQFAAPPAGGPSAIRQRSDARGHECEDNHVFWKQWRISTSVQVELGHSNRHS